MMKIIFNSDGSIRTLIVGESIQQGNNGVNHIFVQINGMGNNQYTCSALFALPNGQDSAVLGSPYTDDEYGDGYRITLSSSQTLYAGNLKMSVFLKDLQDRTLYTYQTYLLVNPTGYFDTELNINTQMWNNLVQSLNSFLTKDTVQIQTRKEQMTVALIYDFTSNINQKYLYNFTSYSTTYAGGWQMQVIQTADHLNLTKEQAARYMKSMTGSEYVPEYNFDYPQNTFLIDASGNIYKAQWVDAYGLCLFKIPNPFALSIQLDGKQNCLYKHEVELINSNHESVLVTFTSTQSTNYDLAGIRALVTSKAIPTVVSNCAIAGGSLQTTGIVCLEVNNAKLYRVAVGFGETISKTLTEITAIYSQTTTAL